MAQPPEYNREADFTKNHGSTQNDSLLNGELDDVSTSINAIRENLALLQNDDGGLRRGVADRYSFTDESYKNLVNDVYAKTIVEIQNTMVEEIREYADEVLPEEVDESVNQAIIDGLNARGVIATYSTTSRILEDRFADIINIKDYGAVGDGVTDDTAAFLAAWAVATQSSRQALSNADPFCSRYTRTLYIPHGRYLITRNAFLNSPSGGTVGNPQWGVRIQGDGMFSSQILFKPTANGSAFYDQTLTGAVAYIGLEFNSVGLLFDDSNVNYTGISEENKTNFFLKSKSKANNATAFFNFLDCMIAGTKYTTVLSLNGTMNESENRFVNCRIRSIKTVIYTDNYESLNNVLLDTDVEWVYGDIIDNPSGSEVTWIGGSCIFHADATDECAIVNFGGDYNSNPLTGGQVSVQNIRCEFRAPYSRVFRCLDNNVRSSLSFSDCTFQKFNHGQDFGKLAINNGANIAFLNCSFPPKTSPSRLKFVDNPAPQQNASSPNRSTSVVCFRDCMSSSGSTNEEYNFYADFSEVTIPDTSRTQAVIYDNCEGLPSLTQYGSKFRCAMTAGHNLSDVPFRGNRLPAISNGTEDYVSLYPRLKLPAYTYVVSVSVNVKGNSQAGNQNIAYDIVDEAEFTNPGSGTVYATTTAQPNSAARSEEVPINEMLIAETTLYLRVNPDYTSGSYSSRLPDYFSVSAKVA